MYNNTWYEVVANGIDLTDEYDKDVFVRYCIALVGMFVGAFLVGVSAPLVMAVVAVIFVGLFAQEDLGHPTGWSFEVGVFSGALLAGIALGLFVVIAGVFASLLALSQYKRINRWVSDHRKIPEIFRGGPAFTISGLVAFILAFSLSIIFLK